MRLRQRTQYDIEMIRQIGSCTGIENYSRYFDGRKPGEAPFCLLDYFPEDFLMFIDESHVTVPQIRGMFNGDRARKKALVDYGFRLPSAFDNRPLVFDEFRKLQHQTIYVSATPAEYELAIAREHRGADHPPHGAFGSAGDAAQGHRPGGRSDRRDPQNRGAGRARAGDHAHQAHGGKPDRIPA